MDNFGKLTIKIHIQTMRGNQPYHKQVALDTIYCLRSEVAAKYAEWRANNPAVVELAKLQDVTAFFETSPEFIGFAD